MMVWPATVIDSEAPTTNQPPGTDIIIFQTSEGIACGTSSRQNLRQGDRWYMRAASISSVGTVRSDWYTLNVMFHACEVKIAKIAAHSTPSRRPGNSAIKPVTVIDRNPRIGTDCRTSRAGIRIFSAARLL